MATSRGCSWVLGWRLFGLMLKCYLSVCCDSPPALTLLFIFTLVLKHPHLVTRSRVTCHAATQVRARCGPGDSHQPICPHYSVLATRVSAHPASPRLPEPRSEVCSHATSRHQPRDISYLLLSMSASHKLQNITTQIDFGLGHTHTIIQSYTYQNPR